MNVHEPIINRAYQPTDLTFMKQGADPWAADRCGRRTALHYACMKGYPACVRALLENLSTEQQERGDMR